MGVAWSDWLCYNIVEQVANRCNVNIHHPENHGVYKGQAVTYLNILQFLGHSSKFRNDKTFYAALWRAIQHGPTELGPDIHAQLAQFAATDPVLALDETADVYWQWTKAHVSSLVDAGVGAQH